jgi:hypothetical protein
MQAAAQPAAQPAVVAAQFFRGPGEVIDPNAPQFIDYSIESNKKAYKYAVSGLTEKFDLTPSKLQSFLNRVNERVAEQNWTGIINIIIPAPALPIGAPAPPVINLITNYGQVTLDQVRNHANAYCAINNQTRNNQNSLMLYMFLSNSLDTTAHNAMDINPEKYRINGLNEGALFLKEIITKAYVDTNATVDTIRKSISKLDDKIKEMKFDIKLFNTYVKTQVNALLAHGIECTELITNLFSAYKEVPDDEFLHHVQMYYFQYTSANMRGQAQDLTNEIMVVLEQNFHRRMEEGTWNPKNIKTDKERIIALETVITELRATPTEPKRQNNDRNNRNYRDETKYAWKKIAPKPGKPHVLQKNKKTYHWCANHAAWCIHTQEQCELKNIASETTENSEPTPEATPARIIVDPVLQSIVGSGRIFA